MKGKTAASSANELIDNIVVDGQAYTITTRDLGPRDPLVNAVVMLNKAVKSQKSVDYGRYANRPNVKEIVAALVKRVHYELVEGVLTGRLHTETL
jgi:hypothetical protein